MADTVAVRAGRGKGLERCFDPAVGGPVSTSTATFAPCEPQPCLVGLTQPTADVRRGVFLPAKALWSLDAPRHFAVRACRLPRATARGRARHLSPGRRRVAFAGLAPVAGGRIRRPLRDERHQGATPAAGFPCLACRLRQRPAYRGVEVRTTAQLLDAGRTNLSREMAVRYLGQDAGEAYAAAAGSADLVLVRLEPGEVRTWDFADEM